MSDIIDQLPQEFIDANTVPQTLDQIGRRHACDKSSSFHAYLDIYARYFEPLREQPIGLIEIGIAGGASIRTWLEYFPNAKVVGIDHDQKAVDDALTNIKEKRFTAVMGDASTDAPWHKIKQFVNFNRVDIVIDDGSHNTYAIIQAFQLGFPHLKPGGLWIVEDCHAVFLPEYNRDNHLLGIRPTDHALKYFGLLATEGAASIQEGGKGQCGKPQDVAPIKSITFFKSLVIIERA